MNPATTLFERPQRLATFCAIAATVLGLIYLELAGAPTRHLAINASALLLGLVIAAAGVRTLKRLPPGTIACALALGLLGTSFAGVRIEGAARWLSLGGVALQPSLIVLPLIAMLLTQAPGRATFAGVAIAAVALAVQPDRAMAAALMAAMAMIALLRPGVTGRIALVVSLSGFAATSVQPDTVPPAPFVEGILRSSFDVHPLAAAAVWAGSAILLLPAFARGGGLRTATFGAFWGTIVLAAAIGNYPTPLVGYGASAILGYAFSLALLPRGVAKMVAGDADASPPRAPQDCAMTIA